MPAADRNRLPDPIPSLQEFEGIINTRRSKDIGYAGLTIGRNVEVTDTKKLVRRNGYSQIGTGDYAGLYGVQTQQFLYGVHAGNLVRITANGSEVVLAPNHLDGTYSWDEDPANNVYYTSTNGSNGIILNDGITWLPLALAVPSISSVAVIDTAPWTVTPFDLGKTYTANAMQLFATYLYADGRESAPSEVVTVSVAPEVKLLQVVVPQTPNATTLVYATAPGGSSYYLVAQSANASFTFSVAFLNMNGAGSKYPYMTSLQSFPTDAYLLAHFGGKLFAATYSAQTRLGAVYYSLPLQYHLFNMEEDFFMTSGSPLLMLTCKEGIVVGTDSNIYLWKEPSRYEHQIGMRGGSLEQLAEYGVVPGICGDVTEEGVAYFWTVRGVAKAMPYGLVTKDKFSADPGTFNNGKIFYDRGYVKFIASIIAGNPVWNAWQGR